MKSENAQILLVLMFGPLGLLYTNWKYSLVMIAIGWLWLPLNYVLSGDGGLLYAFVSYWISLTIVAMYTTSAFNSKVIA